MTQKPTLLHVGFFMNKTGIFRQWNWSIFNQTGYFTSVINSSSA